MREVEQEQDRLTLHLQTQVAEMRRDRETLLQREEEESEAVANRLNTRIAELREQLAAVEAERDALSSER